MMKAPKGYRLLRNGDKMLKGDLYWNQILQEWTEADAFPDEYWNPQEFYPMARKLITITREGKDFNAHFLPFGVASYGKTEKEAEKRLYEAIGLYVVSYIETNGLQALIDELEKGDD